MPEFGKGPEKRKSPLEARERERNSKMAETIALAKELIESGENFPFPEIDSETLSKMKATDAEFPGYSTPVETLIDRFRSEGIKVIFTQYSESGNICIVPAGGSAPTVEDMYIFPRHLLVNETMNEKLKALITADKVWFDLR